MRLPFSVSHTTTERPAGRDPHPLPRPPAISAARVVFQPAAVLLTLHGGPPRCAPRSSAGLPIRRPRRIENSHLVTPQTMARHDALAEPGFDYFLSTRGVSEHERGEGQRSIASRIVTGRLPSLLFNIVHTEISNESAKRKVYNLIQSPASGDQDVSNDVRRTVQSRGMTLRTGAGRIRSRDPLRLGPPLGPPTQYVRTMMWKPTIRKSGERERRSSETHRLHAANVLHLQRFVA